MGDVDFGRTRCLFSAILDAEERTYRKGDCHAGEYIYQIVFHECSGCVVDRGNYGDQDTVSEIT